MERGIVGWQSLFLWLDFWRVQYRATLVCCAAKLLVGPTPAVSVSGCVCVTPSHQEPACSSQEILLFCSACLIIGNSVYLRADEHDRLWMVMFGRIFAGIGASIGIAAYGHISRTSPRLVKASRISHFKWAENFGRVFAPGESSITVCFEDGTA